MMNRFHANGLPGHKRTLGLSFERTASQIFQKLPFSTERSVALRKLLEAQDCAFRAADDYEASGKRLEPEDA